MTPATRYHPLLVALHWLLAVFVIGALLLGFFYLAATPNSDPQKIAVLRLHMAGGMVILALMLLRFIIRLRTARPRTTRAALISHYGFYLLLVLMAGTGLATAIAAGLNSIVLQHSGEPLPPSFSPYPAFIAHGLIASLLAGLIALHVLVALHHQFVSKDSLLARMFFGRRV
jgi:cytochrome b561